MRIIVNRPSIRVKSMSTFMYGFEAVKDRLPGSTVHLSSRLEHIYNDCRARYPHLHHQMITPLQAQFMAFLVQVTRPRRILELGSFCGYSAAVLQYACPQARVHCVESNSEYCRVLRENLPEATVHNMTCKDYLSDHQAESFDFCFVDADKRGYPVYRELLRHRMEDSALVIYDNVLLKGSILEETFLKADSTKTVMRQFVEFCVNDHRSCVLLPAFDGLLMERICKGSA